MKKYDSMNAIKKAIGDDGLFAGKINAIVEHGNDTYQYSNIYLKILYNVSYMQMDVDIVWEDDTTQVDYKTLGLHGSYNTNFQEFSFSNGFLQWFDGDKKIMIKF